VGASAWGALQSWGSGLTYTSQVFGSFRANDTYGTIFYDADNTGYYCDPNSVSRLATVRSDRLQFGGSDAYMFATDVWAGGSPYPGYQFIGGNSRFGFSSTSGYVDVYTDGNFYAGIDLNGSNNLVHHDGNAPRARNTNLMYYQGFTLDANTMDSNATGFTYSVNAPATGPVARFSTGGGYDMWLNASYNGTGPNLFFRTRNGDAGTINPWRAIPSYGVNANIDSLFATIYYDGSDTGYYLDPNSSGVALRISGAIRGDHVGWTGEHNKIQWHSSHMYFQNMNDGYWIFRRSNGSEPFLLHADGWGQATGSWRAPIFYDSNDTGYYADFNSTAANCARFAGGIHVSVGNVSGQGIILADDGDIVDLNDGFCAMRFSSGVRIHSGNRTGSPTIRLGNGGNIIANDNITAYGSASDRRLKENIQPLTGALDKVLQLQGCTFNWKETTDERDLIGIKEDIGFIADEVQAVIPEMVRTGVEGYLSLRDRGFSALLVEALKEQNQEVVDLRNRVAQLESLINKLIGD
jgi:hypothetical protein